MHIITIKADPRAGDKASTVKSRASKITGLAGIILFLTLLLTPLDAHALNVGDKSPDFRITTVTGKEISYYKDLKGRRPVYLVFWATW
jgi:hypothetical protein